MASNHPSESQRARAPLGEAIGRINTPRNLSYKPHQSLGPELVPNPLQAYTANNRTHEAARPIAGTRNVTSTTASTSREQYVLNPIAEDGTQVDDKRNSHMSTSTASSSKNKTHVGPWNLGKTLGKGSASRVRLARHHLSGQLAAVKILPRGTNHMTQAGSLVELDKWDRRRGEYTAENYIPLAIEREVALMKLIDHPNILKLYDIWENRQEIYLVLEYVKEGDLFNMINKNGPFREDQTVFLFRQVLSAVDYCHSFNICHRDLKPENILINEFGEVKVADFGMACIQQSPTHKLRTSCGSPHYAAPELVSNKPYKGDKVDVWSLGVVLYAMLTCLLPFDNPDTSVLLAMARKGVYKIPDWVSPEAKSLLKGMIEVNPEKRISIKKIWKHPLMRKYDYLDNLQDNGGQPPEIDNEHQCGQVQPEDVDMQLLRQLKSLWHTYSEKFLAMKLTSPEPNDQKLFYWLLYKYREKGLENYAADLTYSASDYHHLRPKNWKKKVTTMEFPSNFGRTPSRFTVISTVATDADGEALETKTDAGTTVRSYDPYKSSLNLDIDTTPSHAKIVVHRNGSSARASLRSNRVNRQHGSMRSSSTYSRNGVRRNLSSGIGAPGRSLNSIKSGESVPYTRVASRHRRGVDFSHVRRRSNEQYSDETPRAPASIAGDDTTVDRDHTADTSPARKARLSRNSGRGRTGIQSMANLPQMSDEAPVWMDELRHLSSSIAKDCDDAFNSTLLSNDSAFGDAAHENSTMSFSLNSGMSPLPMSTPVPIMQSSKGGQDSLRPWDNRPLPQAPTPSASVLREIERVKSEAASGQGYTDNSPGHAERVLTHIDQIVQPGASSKSSQSERRVASAPIYSQYSTKWGRDAVPLPSIYEGSKQDDSHQARHKQRIVSAPTESTVPHPTRLEERKGLDFLAKRESTIRMVQSPSGPPVPAVVPAPLQIRKKVTSPGAEDTQSHQGLDLRQQYRRDELEEPIVEEPSIISNGASSTTSTVKKKPSWFKRTSKDKEAVSNSRGTSASSNPDYVTYTGTTSPSEHTLQPTKKKSLNLAFWRFSREQEPRMELSLAGPDFDEPPSRESARMFNHPSRPLRNQKQEEQAPKREIEPQQNWLARLFRVKPATKHLCFSISRLRARQETVILLRDWRKYGIRDVEVDKQRNIVFARVGKANHFNMKEVSFAVEIMTVIEHGRRNQLSIIRVTQERGAASSFHKVVDTMHSVFEGRHLLVEDKRKIKMMIKTLNS